MHVVTIFIFLDLLLGGLHGIGEDVYMTCAFVSFNQNKTYYFIKNGLCYNPVGSSSFSLTMTLPQVYNNIGNQALLFRIVSGSNILTYDYFTSALNYSSAITKWSDRGLNFKSPLLQEWTNLTPVTLNLTINIGTSVAAWLLFNVNTDDNTTSWFSKNNLAGSSPWNVSLLIAASYNFFSIEGTLGRRFYMSRRWNGCPNDIGVMMLLDAVDDCGDFPGMTNTSVPPFIVYAESGGDGGFILRSPIYDSTLEIWATYDKEVAIVG